VFTSLADGVVDRQFSSSINLVGKNVTGYGEVQNENFLFLLENFAGMAPPINQIQGQVWYDNSLDTLKLKVYNGYSWDTLITSITTATTPASTVAGLWYDTTKDQLFLGTGSGTNWSLLGPESIPGFKKTKFESSVLLDTNSRTHSSIKLFNDGKLLGVITTSSFGVKNTQDVYTASIRTVVAGINLAPGIGLQTNYISAGATTSTGTLVGNWSVNSLTAANTVTTSVLSVSSYGYMPTLFSDLTSSGEVVTTKLSTGDAATTGTIKGTWSLSAGSKLTSTYADLAENYTADDTYGPGTVVEFGGTAETTICQTDMSTAVAGIISTAPAYLMNDHHLQEEHVYPIALSGRVPCHVKGTIKKGDLLVSGAGGFARADTNPKVGTVIAKAMEDYDSTDVGQIEVMVWRG
jgi:hypothetical protein